VVGVVGTLLGLVLGYLMASALASGSNTFLLQYMPGVHLEIVIHFCALIGPAFLGIVTTLIAGYLPARSASRISPMEGLRASTQSDSRRVARWGLIVAVS